MEQIVINGANRLKGSVEIEGAKNAALPILAATILTSEGKVNLDNIPPLSDVIIMGKVLEALNIKVEFDKFSKTMSIDATADLNSVAPQELVEKMRASIVVLGPLVARLGYARVAMPGGCAIGSRPIDLHLKGLKQLGIEINQQAGFIEATAKDLHGAEIYLDFPSVGATQNIMMAATLAEGNTVIENVAREPEIVDLANILNKMGAQVSGAGTDTIKIKGVKALHGCEHSVVQDRIEAGTYMVAAAVSKGDVLIEDAMYEHNRPLISKLIEMGVKIEVTDAGIHVVGPEVLQPTDVQTMPHPGFPTDMQAQMTVAQLMSNGTSAMNETVFENRFMHLEELKKMNAKFRIEGNSAILEGPTKFSGAQVSATDLRAAAALVIAGVIADGETRVSRLEYMDRGYYQLVSKFKKLGVDIKRVSIDESGRETLITDITDNSKLA
ncbi:UDP-N-acetylglucosamine 1-carboxyvinyltransferase 1 [Companilactobacillus sp. RD055328]|uniref:UDP-N-acetylglucosamine 1-carboxyvinyltransferase n=1 Tax=Companilactobacillus sp. RD055328 TaxID=2916634 RepID=UPI001FC85689|nr:UDP-N-acetylglucosamine 1-carboxyvinyltransferase [Companilactobacillus sp. RD055328]GKQ42878.1 UDP-N-acetylglucosamine 1-carboxyvinyltransferase 1 [Companilactobacillus sp. RD055328]